MQSDEEKTMPVETYTDIWRGKKRLYALYDFQLPTPIPVVGLGAFAATALLWMPILYTIGVPFASPIGFVAYLSLPVGLALLADKEIFEKKSLPAYLLSQMQFLFQSKQYDDSRGVNLDNEEEEIILEPKIYVSLRETYPAPRKKPQKLKKQKSRAKSKV